MYYEYLFRAIEENGKFMMMVTVSEFKFHFIVWGWRRS